ncbi:MAG TPA: ABC transporter substrate-binding protein [Blastocatellia bacterium]|nr:ABC transporter substrate-binding protein [Blastocatellia bacterium]
MKKIIVAVVVMTAMIAGAGCKVGAPGGASGTPNPPFQGDLPRDVYKYTGESGIHGGTLVTSVPDDPKTFNIILASDNASADVLWFHIFRCPVDYRNGGNPPDFDPGLCTKWEASSDAKTWTFYLRQGVRWSDGEPFNADDVVFTYNVIVDKNVVNPAADVFLEGKDENGEAIVPDLEKLDDYTVRFKLHSPNGSFLDAVYNLWLIPKHKWEQDWRAGRFTSTMALSEDPSNIVGLGPFRLKEFVSGQRVVLERNPYFWKVDSRGQRLPYLDRMVFVIAKDFNTVQSKFAAGEIDVMPRVRPQDYALVKRMESPEIRVEEIGVSYDTNWLVFNQNTGNDKKTHRPFVEPWKQKLFRDVRFRQAVSYAIDREALANTVFSGRAVPLYSFVTPGDTTWFSDDVMKYSYDPGRARQMLAEIGLKDSNGDGVLEDSEGHSVEFSIVTNATNNQRVETASFISRNLKDVGLKANTNPVAFSVLIDNMQSNFDFDAMVLGWQPNPPTGPSGNKNIVLSSGQQHACFASQRVPSTEWEARADKLMQQIESSADQAERHRLFAQVQRIWSEFLPEINLVAPREAVAFKNKFGNLHPVALPPRATWNCEEIYLKK